LSNGILTNKYLTGIPADSRAARDPRHLKPESLTDFFVFGDSMCHCFRYLKKVVKKGKMCYDKNKNIKGDRK
jgi:hypothetical protein